MCCRTAIVGPVCTASGMAGSAAGPAKVKGKWLVIDLWLGKQGGLPVQLELPWLVQRLVQCPVLDVDRCRR